jgi:CRP-like cAMP-binding protein
MNAVPLIPDTAALQESLAYLPLETYRAGEKVLTAGSRTGRLLFLRDGAVEVVQHGIQIVKESEPGAMFGDISALLDWPHTADVVALETSRFHVADAVTLLTQNSVALLYVASVLARRLYGTDQMLVGLKKASSWNISPLVI